MKEEYQVLRIDPLTRVGDERGIEKYYRITFKTKGGVTDTVDIDEKDFTEEKAAPILRAAAQNADKILKLGG